MNIWDTYTWLTGILVHTCIIGTFDVQEVNVIENSSTGQVCFFCSFIDGTSAEGCFIQYTNIDTKLRGNLSISRTDITTQCVTGIISGYYSISVFDIESDGTVYTIRPAYHIQARIENFPVSSLSYL